MVIDARMVYLIIALVVVGLGEILLLRKGFKSGKRNLASLRRDTRPTPTSPLMPNKRVAVVPEDAAGESDAADNVRADADAPATPLETPNYQNVVEFPYRNTPAGEYADLKREIRSRERSGKEERSMREMIEEIRGIASPNALTILPETDDDDAYEDVPASAFDTDLPVDENAVALPTPPGQPAGARNADLADPAAALSRPEELDDLNDAPDTLRTPEELIKAGVNLVRQGQLDEGIGMLEEAIESAPGRAEAHFNLGIAYTLKESIGYAIQAYQRAIQLDPQYGKAFFNLGTLHLKQGNMQEAITSLEHAVKLLPDPMKALWNLYEAYRSNDLFTKALFTLQQLIELEPEDASLYNHAGICYVKLGEYAKAIKSWKQSITLGAASQLIHYNLGKTYELRGEFPEAVDQYKKFLAMTRDSSHWKELTAEVQERLANLQRRNG